jgi:hypothetical protein
VDSVTCRAPSPIPWAPARTNAETGHEAGVGRPRGLNVTQTSRFSAIPEAVTATPVLEGTITISATVFIGYEIASTAHERGTGRQATPPQAAWRLGRNARRQRGFSSW